MEQNAPGRPTIDWSLYQNPQPAASSPQVADRHEAWTRPPAPAPPDAGDDLCNQLAQTAPSISGDIDNIFQNLLALREENVEDTAQPADNADAAPFPGLLRPARVSSDVWENSPAGSRLATRSESLPDITNPKRFPGSSSTLMEPKQSMWDWQSQPSTSWQEQALAAEREGWTSGPSMYAKPSLERTLSSVASPPPTAAGVSTSGHSIWAMAPASSSRSLDHQRQQQLDQQLREQQLELQHHLEQRQRIRQAYAAQQQQHQQQQQQQQQRLQFAHNVSRASTSRSPIYATDPSQPWPRGTAELSPTHLHQRPIHQHPHMPSRSLSLPVQPPPSPAEQLAALQRPAARGPGQVQFARPPSSFLSPPRMLAPIYKPPSQASMPYEPLDRQPLLPPFQAPAKASRPFAGQAMPWASSSHSLQPGPSYRDDHHQYPHSQVLAAEHDLDPRWAALAGRSLGIQPMGPRRLKGPATPPEAWMPRPPRGPPVIEDLETAVRARHAASEADAVEALFATALALVRRYRQAPFDINSINNEMRRLQPGFDVRATRFQKFLELCRAMEAKNYLRLVRVGNIVMAAAEGPGKSPTSPEPAPALPRVGTTNTTPPPQAPGKGEWKEQLRDVPRPSSQALEADVLASLIQLLNERGRIHTGELGTRLRSLSPTHYALLKEQHGGLRAFLDRRTDVFVVENDHQFNPHVSLRPLARDALVRAYLPDSQSASPVLSASSAGTPVLESSWSEEISPVSPTSQSTEGGQDTCGVTASSSAAAGQEGESALWPQVSLQLLAEGASSSEPSPQSSTPASDYFSGNTSEVSLSSNVEVSRHLWLGNVPAGTSKEQISRVVGQFGEVESIRVFSDRPYAFVNFMRKADAAEAVGALAGKMQMGNKQVSVSFCTSQQAPRGEQSKPRDSSKVDL